ncbi:MAG TPA: PAS domain-containing protein, partial [Kineobactrum sp.]
MPHPYLAKIVLGYALVAFLYITLSDALLFEFWPRAQDVPAVSMVKGWGFVLVTTATLWLLLRRLQRAENRRYRVLLDNHHAVVLVVDPETRYVVDASPAAALFYGWSRTELLKKRIDEINILDSAGILEEVKRATANTVPVFHFQHRLASGEV